VKRATNVTSDLLDAAHDANVNLSATLERALAEELASRRRARWRKENRDAIAAYNEYVNAHGTFSDEVRRFQWLSSKRASHGVTRRVRLC
jgi:antitoxin CcdA